MKSGQALVIVLLIMAVVLTIGLSIGSQTVTDIKISKREEESARAFSAAEAGIEEVLFNSSQTVTSGTVENANYQTEKTNFGAGVTELAYPYKLASGDSATLFFMSHDANGNLSCALPLVCFTDRFISVYWGTEGDVTANKGRETTPALEIGIIHNQAGTHRIARGYYDPFTGASDPDTGRRSNRFAAVTDSSGNFSVGGSVFKFRQLIDLGPAGFNIPNRTIPGVLVMMRIKLHYNSTPQKVGIRVNSAGSLPSQGVEISSTGTYGQSTQKVKVFQLFPDAPALFDYTLYSGDRLIK